METEKSRLEQFKEFVDLDPSDTFSRYALGMEYMGVGDFTQAIAQFDEVIRLDPTDASAHFQAANAYEHSNNKDRAIEYLRKGIEVAGRKGDRHAKDEMTAALEKLEEEL
jgi:Tfp pilus assembly protein PilF